MIKIKIILLSLSFPILIVAQDLSVLYKLNKNGAETGFYRLDIYRDNSVFYESNYCENNLAVKSDLIISKQNKKSDTIYLLDKIDGASIYSQKSFLLNWKILDEKKNIAGYKSHKAEFFYKDEKWIAWFTNDLPFQDGPFIFKGLPGLILIIENENYRFELVEISKYKTFCDININNRKEISYEKYESIFKNISEKNTNLINSISNLNLDLEIDLKSTKDKVNTTNILREIL